MTRRAGRRPSANRWTSSSGPEKPRSATEPDYWSGPLPDSRIRRTTTPRVQCRAVCFDCNWLSERQLLVDNRLDTSGQPSTSFSWETFFLSLDEALAYHHEAWVVIRSAKSSNRETAGWLTWMQRHHEHQSGHRAFLAISLPSQARARYRRHRSSSRSSFRPPRQWQPSERHAA